jgi:two-component system sensor histidine kinase KdpD
VGEREPEPGDGMARSALEVLVALAAATALVALLELVLRVGNASSVYLIGVAAVAIRRGTVASVAAAIGAFLVYNLLFVEPRITFFVARADELVTLVLLLFVGVLIGRLAGLQRDRERLSRRREREARALFAVSRELATARHVEAALPNVLERLVGEVDLSRAWVGIGPTTAQERVVADTDTTAPVPAAAIHAVLRRDREEAAATWVRVRAASVPTGGTQPTAALYRVALRAGEEEIGSLWATRPASGGDPPIEGTRLLAVVADQIAQGVIRERLAVAAADAEVAQRSEELRSALLDSVSHDLRTPLASIRAAAGSIADPTIELEAEERRATARSIDAEAERLNQLVSTLLDMSRIQAGALVPTLEAVSLAEIVEPVVARLRPELAGREFTVDVDDDLPPVLADATYVAQILANLLENAIRHAPEPAAVAVRAEARGDRVRLAVEDGGPGVGADALGRLFERFYRAPAARSSARRGIGLGLTVVRGLVEAMGGTVRAERSALGGLAVVVELVAAPMDR